MSQTGNNKIELKSIHDLLSRNEKDEPEYQFNIPSYQRGYKWGKDEVNYLLNDIWEFATKENKEPNEIYCLQPVVVKKPKDKVEQELIDGQQRLTTIYLILAYYNFECFNLEYKTRAESGRFLKKLSISKAFSFEEKESNVDYWHICNAWETIWDWLIKMRLRKDFTDELFLDCFLNEVKIIWYEVDENIESREIYSRLNIGKIPLTNAELIKALILSKTNGLHEKSKMAIMWDKIETSLQDDKIWCFLTNTEDVNYGMETRIDFLIDIIANKPEEKKKDEREKYFSFQRFQAIHNINSSDEDKTYWKDKKVKSLNDAWEKVEEIFQIILDWYEDGKIYHYIGFAICYPLDKETQNIQDLILLYKGLTKSEFIRSIKFKIFEHLSNDSFKDLRKMIDEINAIKKEIFPENHSVLKQKVSEIELLIRSFLENQSYKTNNNKVIEKILLLFNISTVMHNQKALEDKNGKETLQTFGNIFPFDLFKKGNKWDIEHVHSQTDKQILKKEEQLDWLYNSYLDGDNKIRESISNIFGIEDLMSESDTETLKLKMNATIEKLTPSNFEIKKKELSSQTEMGISKKDSLFNLTLLDCKTNRSYQNAFFPTKRRILMNRDKGGQFVPICTKNLFQKYYTEGSAKITLWTDDDATGYRNIMTEMFANMIKD